VNYELPFAAKIPKQGIIYTPVSPLKSTLNTHPMSLLDSFISLALLFAMLLYFVFMCRNWLKNNPAPGTAGYRYGRYTPVFPQVSKQKKGEESNTDEVSDTTAAR
jgi:hypothetical protein